MKTSRRRFLKLAAAGTAAAVAAPEAALAAAAKRARGAARPAPKPAPHVPDPVAAEIARQKSALAQTLVTLRAFPLGNDDRLAFTFAPLRAKRGRR